MDAIAIHEAFKRGDLEALESLLGNPSDFPNFVAPLWMGNPLEYAIYHSPLPFIQQLLELGANPSYENHAGFPSLMAALSADQTDKPVLIALLLSYGANIQQVGYNGYTPLHWDAADNEPGMVELLLKRGGRKMGSGVFFVEESMMSDAMMIHEAWLTARST